MPTKKRPRRVKTNKISPARGTGPQGQVARLLAAHADGIDRRTIGTSLSTITAQAISQTLWYMKKVGRARQLDGDKWQLTEAGFTWAREILGDVPAAPPAPRQARPGGRAAEPRNGAVSVISASTVPVAKPSFRCAVISDGGFFIEKDGTRVDLEPDESRALLRYLDRMAADQAA